MSNNHPDKAILVTGASTCIGRASALALLDAEFRIFACVRNERAAASSPPAPSQGSRRFRASVHIPCRSTPSRR
jgi:NAD(P)-dependent dehydrogenase (short-subunit alcohol dehydrogenase family)